MPDTASQTLTEAVAGAERMQAGGDLPGAIRVYQDWLAAHGDVTEAAAAWFNLGTLFSSLGDRDEAARCYRRSLEVRPGFWAPTVNLAGYLEARKEIDEAIALYQIALGMPQPDDALVTLCNQLGRLFEGKRMFAEATEQYYRSLTARPDQADAFQHWMHVRQKQCAWPLLMTARPMSVHEVATMVGPLGAMAMFDDPDMLLLSARAWGARHVRRDHAPLARGGYGHRKLRIGYISCDFRMHAVCFLSAQIYECHDRERFEIFAFDNSQDDGSAWRARIINGVDHFLPIHTLSDEQAAALIRSHEIDILVDMMGLTAGARPDIIARKPAPVQISYLGFLGPCGIEQIDYILADDYVIPPEAARCYTEKPLYLPRCFQVNNRLRQVGRTPTRAEHGLPDDAFVYCVINNSYKLTPEVFGRWMRILQRQENSVLWMLEENDSVRANLLAESRRYGVAESRIIFARPIMPQDYLARFQCADLFLDTSPYNAGATASDALSMGLPVLTCPGKTYVSRMAASLLRELGLPEMIAPTWAAYETMALALARDRRALDGVRARLAEANRSSRLYDTPGFVRDLESLYTDVAGRHGLLG